LIIGKYLRRNIGNIKEIKSEIDEDFYINFLQNNNASAIKSNKTKSNSTNSKATFVPVIIDKAPYKPTDCSETVIVKAKKLVNDYDYAKKTEAFFSLSALTLNVFDKNNANALNKSLNMKGISLDINVLKGSLNCQFFHQENKKHHNISMCIEDKNTTAQILSAFNFFHKCASHGDRSPSSQEVLEVLLNTLNNPNQTEYIIPSFKKSLNEDLTARGFFVSDSNSKNSKKNCKKDAEKIVLTKPNEDEENLDDLRKLDKKLTLVPGNISPLKDQNIYHTKKNKKNE
jgi:hypothetical protein